MSRLSLPEIPTTDPPHVRTRRSSARKALVRSQLGRRGFILGGLTSASVVALGAFDGFLAKIPGVAAAPAAPTWNNCRAYLDAARARYGGTDATYALWAECNPHASQHPGNVGDDGVINPGDIGSKFCASDGYHRRDYVVPANPDANRRKYDRRPYSCAGKNAWVWRVDLGRPLPNKRSRLCSDGKVEIIAPGGRHKNWFNTVCERRLPQYDPDGVTLTADEY
ncbi:hypothetical protein ABFU82_21860 [Nocardioides sp. WV_118_6]|uniref:hypothetical protein n=1 Tax=Nocardioides simplex TaxID=2045 RepID=UPI0021504B14|nr:hypothetical protein [Pimelobacter simplex]UUW91326.1 hypothetical protein M0M43_07500 [Pimelobacter simplex]UUW95154.1 hypothetical protein M0M48_26005 [Pimelobacter simplex]